MINTIKSNIIFLMLICLTLNIVGITALGVYAIVWTSSGDETVEYDVIECGDPTGRVHKCIRVDPNAGEVTKPDGASYRVIFGH